MDNIDWKKVQQNVEQLKKEHSKNPFRTREVKIDPISREPSIDVNESVEDQLERELNG